jgi:hypothetical protein
MIKFGLKDLSMVLKVKYTSKKHWNDFVGLKI